MSSHSSIKSESSDNTLQNLSMNNRANDQCYSNPGNKPEFVYLQKWLNYRQFEGCEVGSKYLYLDEYCALIRSFQKNRCIDDEVLLRNIATTITGHALIWWSNNIDKISTLPYFERQLRRRFGHETEYSILHTILNGKQRDDEPLLDYIDHMLNMMRRAENTFSEEEQIKHISNGANIKYQKYLRILISNGLNTIQEFTDKAADYVEYLARRNKNSSTLVKFTRESDRSEESEDSEGSKDSKELDEPIYIKDRNKH